MISNACRGAILIAAVLAHCAWAQTEIETPSPAPAVAKSDRIESVPDELEGVGITEHLGTKIPLALTFTDSEGRTFKLADAFDGKRPVVLNLGYYGCPMLCGLVLDGLLDAMKEIPLSVGKDYVVLTLSIDPTEKAVIARMGKQKAIQKLGQPEAAAAWQFLSGDAENIQKLTDAVGWGFKWNERRQEFAHTAALVVLTPDGVVSRYLYGVQFPPKTLRLSLVEASEGKIGSTLDQILLFCFHYDATDGTYSLAAMNVMRLAGVVTALALGSGIGLAVWRERRRGRRRQEESALSEA
ncbi:MAG: SCO family protein [Phycisphaerae bacterium]|nr:SCO family protein [Phycisphaerae bacterium]